MNAPYIKKKNPSSRRGVQKRYCLKTFQICLLNHLNFVGFYLLT
jgi:hypothetical protein